MKSLILLLACLLPLGAAAQTHAVSGTVTVEESGEPLAHCSIHVKHTDRHTKTDKIGRYRIQAAATDTLCFVMLGYDTVEEAVGNRTRIDIALHPMFEVFEEEEESVAPAYLTRMTGIVTTERPARLSGEEYAHREENRFHAALHEPLSTFALEADGASYANCRRILASGRAPETDAVRIEEFLNYFDYDYPAPEGEAPLSLQVEAGPCPWAAAHRLVRIGLKAREVAGAELPPAHFVYLIDVSGSMYRTLPLVKASMKMLTDNLRAEDRVSIVTYADGVQVRAQNIPGNERRRIKDLIDELEAGGSTAGGAGLEKAYGIARKYRIAEGNNRIILCSDGDFNVGPSSDKEMKALIERQRKLSGAQLSVIGFGMGNYKDSKMQLMAEHGDGNYAYVDDLREAAKVLFGEFGATAWAAARDVKM